MAVSSSVLWGLFVAGSLSITIVLVAFVAALSIAQRQRLRFQRHESVLVARAHEEERSWVAGELHDDVLQRIAVVRQDVERLWTEPEHRDAPHLECHLRAINAELVDLAAAVRGIAARIHPTVVDQVGLPAAVQSLVDEARRDSSLVVTLECELTPAVKLSHDVARAAFRIVQEALRNAVRHSNGKTVRVLLRHDERQILIRVQDDGCGFDRASVLSRSLGLAGLVDRATGVGGAATIDAQPGRGSIVEVLIPWPPRQ